MTSARGSDVGPTASRTPRRTGRPALTRPALATLVLGIATLIAGGYRAAVELSDDRVHALVPIAVGAPLAAELLLLVAGVVVAAAALLIAASRRRTRS